jgi:hypothetical protein
MNIFIAFNYKLCIPCKHSFAVIDENRLNPFDPLWLDPVYHASTLKDMYSAPVPNLTTWNQLFVAELVPAEFCPTALKTD